MMDSKMRVGLGFLGAIIGFPIGSLIGHYSLYLLGRVVFGREFYQIAWLFAGLMVLGGGILGAIVGASTGAAHPRRFVVIFIPLALFFLAAEVTQYYLRQVEKPRSYTIEVEAEEEHLRERALARGRKFSGTITADGAPNEVKGTIPASFTFEAIQVDYEICLIDDQEGEWFSVALFVDGDLDARLSSHSRRITGHIESRGTGWWARTLHWGGSDPVRELNR